MLLKINLPLPRRLVRLHAQKIRKYPALLRRKRPLVPRRIQHRLPLIQRDPAQIIESPLHHRLPILRQISPLLARPADARSLIRRQALQHLIPRQPALPLLLWHLVHLPQLLCQPLLIVRGQLLETRIAAQHPFLILQRNIAVLIQPVSQVSLRRNTGVGKRISWCAVICRPPIRGA